MPPVRLKNNSKYFSCHNEQRVYATIELMKRSQMYC